MKPHHVAIVLFNLAIALLAVRDYWVESWLLLTLDLGVLTVGNALVWYRRRKHDRLMAQLVLHALPSGACLRYPTDKTSYVRKPQYSNTIERNADD